MTGARLVMLTLLTGCNLLSGQPANTKVGNCTVALPSSDTGGQAGTVTATFMGTSYTSSCFQSSVTSSGFQIENSVNGPTERFEWSVFFGNMGTTGLGIGTMPCSYTAGTPVPMSSLCLAITTFGLPPSGEGLWDFEASAGHDGVGAAFVPAPTGTVTPVAIPTAMGQLMSITFSSDATLWYSPTPGAAVTLVPISGSAAIDTATFNQ